MVASFTRAPLARQEGASTVARLLKLFSHNSKARGGSPHTCRARRIVSPTTFPSPSFSQIERLTNEADKTVHASSRNSFSINKRIPPQNNFSYDVLYVTHRVNLRRLDDRAFVILVAREIIEQIKIIYSINENIYILVGIIK